MYVLVETAVTDHVDQHNSAGPIGGIQVLRTSKKTIFRTPFRLGGRSWSIVAAVAGFLDSAY